MEPKKNIVSVREHVYLKDKVFRLEQDIQQLSAALEARLELVARKLNEYNQLAERVNTIIGVCEQASVGLSADETPVLPKRLAILNKQDFRI